MNASVEGYEICTDGPKPFAVFKVCNFDPAVNAADLIFVDCL